MEVCLDVKVLDVDKVCVFGIEVGDFVFFDLCV